MPLQGASRFGCCGRRALGRCVGCYADTAGQGTSRLPSYRISCIFGDVSSDYTLLGSNSIQSSINGVYRSSKFEYS
jgi:hypothetical protein